MWLLDEIDLHIVPILLVLAPIACVSWWGLAVLLLLPQGRICTRAFVDYPAFQQRPWGSLAANELMVGGVVAVATGVRLAVGG